MTTGPNFFIIGAAKAATTSLSSLLASHPEATIVQGKEPHFFSYDPVYRLGWERYLDLFRHCAGELAVGDSSTSYSRIRYHPAAPLRILRHVPAARIIYMVRHPIERMESAYVEHMCTRNGPTFASIDEALRRQPMIIDSSRYWEVFSTYRRYFGEKQIKVVWFEEYAASAVDVFHEVCRFLRIDDTVTPDMNAERKNARASATERLVLAGRSGLSTDAKCGDGTRRWVIDQIRDDNTRFLTHFGRGRGYWGPDLF